MTTRRVRAAAGAEAPASPSDALDNFELPPDDREGPEFDPPSNAQGDSIRENLGRTARNVGAAAQEQLSTLGEDVGEELIKAAEKQKVRGVEGIRTVVGVMNTAAAELDESSPAVAGYVRAASNSVANLSQALDARDVKDLFRSALGTAKENPVLFFTGAVAGGFLISRFLRSSSEV